MKCIGIIPARYASTRFPGKPLAMLGGKTVIQRVYEATLSTLDATYVATDDERIYNKVLEFGGQAVMTSPNHQSGTDRIKEALTLIGGNYDIIVNIQGDEPFVKPHQITTLCECFTDEKTQIATLCIPFKNMDEVKKPNSPKIIADKQGFAIYFSRSVIPFIRGKEMNEWLNQYPFMKHLGMYAYRPNVLCEITSLPQSALELAESLEQLRWIENGYKIKIGKTDIETIGIDTPEDLDKAEIFLQSQENNS